MPGNRPSARVGARGEAPWREQQLRATQRRNGTNQPQPSIPVPTDDEVQRLVDGIRQREEAQRREAEAASGEVEETSLAAAREMAMEIVNEPVLRRTPAEGQSWAAFFEEMYANIPAQADSPQVEAIPLDNDNIPEPGETLSDSDIPREGAIVRNRYGRARSSRSAEPSSNFGYAYGMGTTSASNPFATPPPAPSSGGQVSWDETSRVERRRSWDHTASVEDLETHDEAPRASVQSFSQYQSLFGNVEANEEMTTVSQVFGQRASYPTIESHPLIVGTNLAGVEIELENIRNAPPRFRYWETHQDGSLRNQGMEFVCSSPWGGQDLYEAALEIDGYLFNAKPDESWRCSTHVHVDVRDLTVTQLKRLILAYIVFERILFKCSGWHRYKNNFCVALGFAQEQLAILSRFWSCNDADFLNNVVHNWDKYSSLNLLPMSSFGSVEFRISEAKWRKGKLIRLVNRFLSLKELAVEFTGNTDEEFIDWVVALPIHRAIRKGLPKSMPDYEQDVEIGFKLAHDVVSMSKIRRRHIYTHVVKPQSEDDTRRMRVQVEAPYWRHIKDHLRRELDGTWLVEDRAPTEITFGWLFELQQKCNELGITFDSDWFVPVTLQRQHRELWQRYRSEQLDGERSRRNREYTPDLYEEPEDDDDEDDEENI